MGGSAKLVIGTAAVSAFLAASSLTGNGCAKMFVQEKSRAERKSSETAVQRKEHRILVVGHSWAEGTFRNGKEDFESSIRFFHGLNVKFKVCSRGGSSIGDARWQLDENFDDGISAIAVFTGRNDWRREDWQIEADLTELCAVLAEKGRPVFIFNSQKVPPGTKDEETINGKVELINSTLERLCEKYGFHLVDVRRIDVGEMADPYHPKSYDAVRRLFAEELENWLSPLLPFSEFKADVLSAAAAKLPSLQAPSKE